MREQTGVIQFVLTSLLAGMDVWTTPSQVMTMMPLNSDKITHNSSPNADNSALVRSSVLPGGGTAPVVACTHKSGCCLQAGTGDRFKGVHDIATEQIRSPTSVPKCACCRLRQHLTWWSLWLLFFCYASKLANLARRACYTSCILRSVGPHTEKKVYGSEILG
jgi:hypothetical protein